MSSMLKRFKEINVSQILLLIMIFVFSLQFFQSTPLERPFFQFQAVFLGFILIFLLFYVVHTLFQEKQNRKIILYFILLSVIVPVYSACMSYASFGQPLVYGVLSERSWFLIGAGIWFYYMMVSQKLSLGTLESAFVTMAWFSLIIFFIVILTYDTSKLTKVGEVSGSGLVSLTSFRGFRFKFQTYFITFGAIYYFVKYELYKKKKYLIMMLIFLSYVVFVAKGRTYILTLAATFFFYYCFNYSPGKLMITAIKIFFFLCVALIVIHIVMPDYLNHMGHLFVQMFKVITGSESEDPSANTRIFQSKIVFQYFTAHPVDILFGTGRVSHHWNGGYESLFNYFFPSDIGALGGLFLYGVMGMIFVCIIPLIITIKTLRKAHGGTNTFIVAMKYLLIFAIVCAIQGSFCFGVMQYVIPLFILLGYTKLQEKQYAG